MDRSPTAAPQAAEARRSRTQGRQLHKFHQIASNTLDDAATVAILEQASLMACGVVGVQHYRRALLLSHFVVV